MKAFLDGNCICIVKDDFINLQESPALFIPLDSIYDGWHDENLKFIVDDMCHMKGCDNWGKQSPGIYGPCKKCLYCLAHEND